MTLVRIVGVVAVRHGHVPAPWAVSVAVVGIMRHDAPLWLFMLFTLLTGRSPLFWHAQ